MTKLKEGRNTKNSNGRRLRKNLSAKEDSRRGSLTNFSRAESIRLSRCLIKCSITNQLLKKFHLRINKSLNLNLKLHRGLLEERSKRNKIATRERLFQMREVEDLRKIISNTRAIDKAIFIDRFVQEEDEQIVSPNITDVEQAIRKARGIYPKRYSRLKNLFETKKLEL